MNIKNIIFDNGNVLADPKTGHWLMPPNFWSILDIDQETNYERVNKAIKKNQYLLTQEPKTEEEEYNVFSNFYYCVLKKINYQIIGKKKQNLSILKILGTRILKLREKHLSNTKN